MSLIAHLAKLAHGKFCPAFLTINMLCFSSRVVIQGATAIL
jgi:hypothetical protein